MIGARLFGAMLFAGGLLIPAKVGARKVTAWNTRSRGFLGAEHSEERVLRAQAKRIQRAAKVRRDVAAGAYGPRPYAGVKGGSATPIRNYADQVIAAHAALDDQLAAKLKGAA